MITNILIFFFLSVGTIYFFLRLGINRNKITRIEHGNHAEVYVNGVLFSSDELLEIELYDFSHC